MENILQMFDTYPLEYKVWDFFAPFVFLISFIFLAVVAYNLSRKIKLKKPVIQKKEKVRIDL